MKTMWAPWRMDYILNEKDENCIFCEALSTADELTLYKGKITMVMMNKFPYINGHLLVAPIRHLSMLDELQKNEMGALMATIEKAVAILKSVMKPDGFNVGLNLGRYAGAGIADHLHMHFVPRWTGDTSFISVLGETRVFPETLEESWQRLQGQFS